MLDFLFKTDEVTGVSVIQNANMVTLEFTHDSGKRTSYPMTPYEAARTGVLLLNSAINLGAKFQFQGA